MDTTELTAVIDRYEEDKAVLLVRSEEDEVPVILPRKFLPGNGKIDEGTILKISLKVCEAATREALSEVEKLLQEILEQQENNEKNN